MHRTELLPSHQSPRSAKRLPPWGNLKGLEKAAIQFIIAAALIGFVGGITCAVSSYALQMRELRPAENTFYQLMGNRLLDLSALMAALGFFLGFRGWMRMNYLERAHLIGAAIFAAFDLFKRLGHL